MTKRTLIPHAIFTLVFTITCLYSCKDSNHGSIEKVVREWHGKEPTPPGGIAHFRVTYEADDVGPFNKIITVHTNANDSPLILHLIGKVQ